LAFLDAKYTTATIRRTTGAILQAAAHTITTITLVDIEIGLASTTLTATRAHIPHSIRYTRIRITKTLIHKITETEIPAGITHTPDGIRNRTWNLVVLTAVRIKTRG
jgi:hypothetical protein